MTLSNPSSQQSGTNVDQTTSQSQTPTPVSARAPPNTPMGLASSPVSATRSHSSSITSRSSPITRQVASFNDAEEEDEDEDDEGEWEEDEEDNDEVDEASNNNNNNNTRTHIHTHQPHLELQPNGLPRPPPLTAFRNMPGLVILHYFILPFCQGAMYGLGETTARFWMRRWFGDMVAPSVSSNALVKKALISNRDMVVVTSPNEEDVWERVVESIFGGRSPVKRRSRVVDTVISETVVGSLAIGSSAGTWGRRVYIPR
ncbi:hypothetical protein SmJEL517_g01463 [Synchytrium microbalum]|uniref:Uncharacterized protein n=1 Tax=Synchytrium microbalum TaxID=1806994 RepID=A0A507CF92_9FUNG|nr:uncharacterized protein SmJEL517_g01463 [Synchytrium microbalum]TPX36255.1 hypothetical protein SmJEL517_g01463 [Synchytrium microbalum]